MWFLKWLVSRENLTQSSTILSIMGFLAVFGVGSGLDPVMQGKIATAVAGIFGVVLYVIKQTTIKPKTPTPNVPIDGVPQPVQPAGAAANGSDSNQGTVGGLPLAGLPKAEGQDAAVIRD